MKKSLFILALAFISTASFAQDFGNLTLNDGKTIFRISVGNERDTDSRSQSQRIARLERAVRELQNRVYDLEDSSRPSGREVTTYTCTLPTSFNGVFIGKASTVAEARAMASNNCSASGAMFCDDHRIKTCEQSTEFQR